MLRRMAHFRCMGSAMDDLDNDVKRTIDDAMDDGELLPFRYLNMLDKL
jgi:hypothetical protein